MVGTPAAALLEVSGLSFARRERRILSDLSLSVVPGEVLAVIGPNGAGKSTLMHLMSGALKPGAGTIRFDGRALSDWPRAALARRRAVLPQSSELSFPFRALDVVSMGRSAHAGITSAGEDLAITHRALDAVDAGALAERLYPTLSGGERQRIQLARVLAQIWPDDEAPRLLLLDEPTNNLDLSHQHLTLRFARALAQRGVAVVAVLHDPNLAAVHADRIAVLADGVIVADGPVTTVLTADMIEGVFGLKVAIQPHPTRGTPHLVAL